MADLLIKTNMKYNITNHYLLSSCKGEGTRKKEKCLYHKYIIEMRWRKGGGGSNSLSVSGLETKRTNLRNMPRLIPIAESEAKLFSSETRDYC